LGISVSHLAKDSQLQLDLPLGAADEARRPGSRRGMARWAADRAGDRIRDRCGWEAIGYGSVVLGLSRSVPDEFRVLAEQELCSAAPGESAGQSVAAPVQTAVWRWQGVQ